MNINWYGSTCFKITASKGKGEQVSIIIDPPDEESGIRGPKLEADILLLTDPAQKIEKGEFFLIDMPGEYDVKEIFAQGIHVASPSVIYVIQAEDIRICHLGKMRQEELSSEQLETIGTIDILMLPVGGGKSLTAETAAKIMSQIEPKITIPMYYSIDKSKEKIDKLNVFLKVLGIENPEKSEKLSIKKKDLPQEDETKIIVLEA
ncbi:MAG: MBL fold metallo-hydrolase [bacterium]|nr:MBL fold metallo-hydrolase [bacterium]